MEHNVEALSERLAAKMERLWEEVSWSTPREKADRIRREVVQACHTLHRTATPAYRERCELERVGERLSLDQLPLVAFPEEVYKAYAERERRNGKKLGRFCERDVPLLLEHLNHYLVHPITMEGLDESYMPFTNIRGGLDRLRADLLAAQGVFVMTSSGTTGNPLSLIPLDETSSQTLSRVYRYMFDMMSTVPGYGPIDPDSDCLVAYSPQEGSMLMAVAFRSYADLFGVGERAFLTIPASVQTRELRWRGGVYAGISGKLLKLLMKPLLSIGGERTARQALGNTITALKKAESMGVRTQVFANQWMAYNLLKELEALVAAEVERGEKEPGEPFVKLAPGSVLVFGGGNKSGLDIPEEEIIALFHKVIGGLDKVVDAYGQAEGFGAAVRCEEGNYHCDPHVEYFTVGAYLAYFDPRQTNRVPAIVTGDVVEEILEEPCPCGAPTRYFRNIQRDEGRGSKGCAAVLEEYT